MKLTWRKVEWKLGGKASLSEFLNLWKKDLDILVISSKKFLFLFMPVQIGFSIIHIWKNPNQNIHRNVELEIKSCKSSGG